MRASRTAVVVAFITALFVGCSQSTSPTVPSAALSVSRAPFGFLTAQSVTIVDDALLDGTAFTLTGFDGVSVLSGINNQGSFNVPYDSTTVFRKAQLDKYIPTDPCRTAAANYNDLGSLNTELTLNGALAAFVTNGCAARVIIQVPPDPIRIRSFRPLAAQ